MDKFILHRRDFLKRLLAAPIAVGGFFFASFAPVANLLARVRSFGRRKHSVNSGFNILSSQEVKTLTVVVRHLAPGVIVQELVEKILGKLEQYKERRTKYRQGLKDLDKISVKRFEKGNLFCQLKFYQQQDIVKSEINNGFFQLVRYDTLFCLYTSSQGWELIGFDGPPQYRGYRDYFTCTEKNDP